MFSIRPNTQNKRVLVTIKEATPRIRKGLRAAFTEIGKENSLHTKNLIKNPPKTGRIYRFRGRNHQASAPGQPPANRSGDLMKSVGSRVYGWEKMEFGDRKFYGKFLEDGTRKMKPRPHLVRTVREKSRDNFITLERTVYNQINKL
jgi:hypothetical protein